ncbi:MAG: T9SS type A sorting domain-containing protein [Bacteroidetes bacterium]|nr:T9SS type A sorting domain-containing protein [Bacteroidota bacterium]
MHVNLINLAPQYWTISAGDGLAGFNYNLELTGDAIPNVSNINYITVIKRHDSSNPWGWNYSNYIPTTGTTINPVLYYRNGTSFSDFGVAGNVENLLPVELSSFTSSINGSNVNLSWATNSEQNNSGFDIERKSDALVWKKIGNIVGHGNTNTPSNYSFTDVNNTSGKYNYRLKQIDFNGNFHYYDLASEVIIGAPKKFVLSQNFPNPFNPTTKINYELPVTNFVSLKIFDMNGREVDQLVNEVQQAGYYNVNFNAAGLPSGTYFYKLTTDKFSDVKKMVLIK